MLHPPPKVHSPFLGAAILVQVKLRHLFYQIFDLRGQLVIINELCYFHIHYLNHIYKKHSAMELFHSSSPPPPPPHQTTQHNLEIHHTDVSSKLLNHPQISQKDQENI